MNGSFYPLISLVMPVRNGELFLSDALQPFVNDKLKNEIEIVVVDDGSVDSTGKILESFHSQSPIEVVLLKGSGEGPGPARNVGMRHARGKYLAFMDSDDIVSPESLIDVCERMSKTGCDLAIYNHCRLYPDGRRVVNLKSNLLEAESPVSNDSDKLRLINNFNVAWNKVYEKDFIDRQGLEFPDGIYEDVPWSICCLALANNVLLVPSVVYTYRQHKSSALKVKGEVHLRLIEQYQLAINNLKQSCCCRIWFEEIKVRALEHAFLVSYKRSRMNAEVRKHAFGNVLRFVRDNQCLVNVLSSSRFSVMEKISITFRTRFFLEVPKLKAKFMKQIKKHILWRGRE